MTKATAIEPTLAERIAQAQERLQHEGPGGGVEDQWGGPPQVGIPISLFRDNATGYQRVTWTALIEAENGEAVEGETTDRPCPGMMQKRFQAIGLGRACIVEYKGAQKMKAGPFAGQDAHTFAIVALDDPAPA